MKHREGKWKAQEEVSASAGRELPKFAEEYFAAGRKAVKRGASAKTLHGFRLSTKHLRYLLELFEPLYGERMETMLGQLKQVQTLLGDLNDYVVTREMMEGNGKDGSHTDTKRLLRHLKQQERVKRAEFRRFWGEEFDGPEREAEWVAYLSRAKASASGSGTKGK